MSAEAVLSDRQGKVSKRKPKDLVLQPATLNSVLVEEEKVRTLSASSAEVLQPIRVKGKARPVQVYRLIAVFEPDE